MFFVIADNTLLPLISHQTNASSGWRPVSFIQQGESQNSECSKNVAGQEAFKWWLLFVQPDNVLKMDANSQTASSMAQMQP